ncbi:WXG100 family type VII secretion target [Saccharothrix sp. Mg75]|uniref:WXG100 family type VII secretion target n=1 Tax=Saccharothrix sp. Mg75 TaxID=3445357 RepID=UPI003EEEB992
MTAGYDDVRKWDAEALDASATNLGGRRDRLVGLQDELDGARKLPDWHGSAGELARGSLGSTRDKAEIMIAELSAVKRALQSASDDVSSLQSRVSNNDALADAYGFHISPDGTIVDNRPVDNSPPGSSHEADERIAAQQHRENIKRQLEQETKAILATANSIDATLARVLRLAQDGKISDDGATTLAAAGQSGEIDAQVVRMEQSLRDAGLLTGPPASGHYRQWLENAVRRGVPIDTIEKIAAEHHITPEDFKVLDGMEEIREDEDGDGTSKSYFMMPTDISGDDAAKAVRMTYVMNAGTDYGTEGEKTDFPQTPYGSGELNRIIERQRANDWSYDEDVAFVHGNGGRLVTTPNGMMMGLGGNLVQDQFSQQGGTAWGDTFMLNIDDPEDAAQQLREVAGSGHVWYDGEGGPQRGDLDLDRLLHHEERHSQQWAREGYTGFLASYVWEQVTGGNETEEDAGLSDGGYR